MIDIKLKELCLYDDKLIRGEIVLAQNNKRKSDNAITENEELKTQLKALGYKDTGERIKHTNYLTGIFEKRSYPLKEKIDIRGSGNYLISFNDPKQNWVENRIITSPYCISTLDSPQDCSITEEAITCRSQLQPRKTFKVNVLGDEITDLFDGLVLMSEKVILDELEDIDYYGLNMVYYPKGDEERPFDFLEESKPREDQIIGAVKKTRQLLKNIFSTGDFDVVREELQKEFDSK